MPLGQGGGGPQARGSSGCVRCNACTCVFSSTDSTTGRSGGSRERPTTSVTFATSSGSLLYSKVSLRCGSRFTSRHTRPTVDAHPRALGQPSATPVRHRPLGLLQGLRHDLRPHLPPVHPRTSRVRRVCQAVHTVLSEARAPQQHRRQRQPPPSYGMRVFATPSAVSARSLAHVTARCTWPHSACSSPFARYTSGLASSSRKERTDIVGYPPQRCRRQVYGSATRATAAPS